MALHRATPIRRTLRERLGLKPRVKPYRHNNCIITLEFEKIEPIQKPPIADVMNYKFRGREDFSEATTLGWVYLGDR